MIKNGQKWPKMVKNGQKWTFLKKNRRDRILSHRDLIDGLKNPEKYCATGGKTFFFHFSTQKKSKMVKNSQTSTGGRASLGT